MLKRLTRKLVALSVLVVALTVVSVTTTRAEPQCFLCMCENSRCVCVPVACP